MAIKWFHPYSAHAKSTDIKVSDSKNCGRVYVRFVVKADEKDNFPKGDFTFKQLTGNGTLVFERNK